MSLGGWQVATNHYSTLGVSPISDDVVVQAAYKALMRKYHPDTSKAADADERAKAINAAFYVLGDAARRASYDTELKRQRVASNRMPPPPPSPPRHPLTSAPANGSFAPPQRKDNGPKMLGAVVALIVVATVIGLVQEL